MTESIDGELTTEAGIEKLIAWHKERAAWWEHGCGSENRDTRTECYINRIRHETTAELLSELVELRNDHECPYGYDCQPD